MAPLMAPPSCPAKSDRSQQRRSRAVVDKAYASIMLMEPLCTLRSQALTGSKRTDICGLFLTRVDGPEPKAGADARDDCEARCASQDGLDFVTCS
jgi:hypothetical protein